MLHILVDLTHLRTWSYESWAIVWPQAVISDRLLTTSTLILGAFLQSCLSGLPLCFTMFHPFCYALATCSWMLTTSVCDQVWIINKSYPLQPPACGKQKELATNMAEAWGNLMTLITTKHITR